MQAGYPIEIADKPVTCPNLLDEKLLLFRRQIAERARSIFASPIRGFNCSGRQQEERERPDGPRQPEHGVGYDARPVLVDRKGDGGCTEQPNENWALRAFVQDFKPREFQTNYILTKRSWRDRL